jgi:hypothetical protein
MQHESQEGASPQYGKGARLHRVALQGPDERSQGQNQKDNFQYPHMSPKPVLLYLTVMFDIAQMFFPPLPGHNETIAPLLHEVSMMIYGL